MELINRIRYNQKRGMDIKAAVDAAVDSCVKDGIMEDFLRKHKAEVISVCLTEFDEKAFADGMREEGFEDGIVKGRIEEKAESILELLEDYGEIPERVRKLIMAQTDLGILRNWLKLAAKVESIEDFEEKIGLVRES